ncbi:uncharacterized protein UV8b_01182 [Ustilaginoidea virens]|uniref:Uncharacterized protein n=1 Tax=Ustilaginoidea virens TaxID=1159556 RepID=A0A8E5MF04_USTVR|nr:uncharacterized protein UV8b_01182 [Ustilaginoidea virens]QUC16941.1 hypothetical protein UV8b_01182 [Ustilaginoidea virens]
MDFSPSFGRARYKRSNLQPSPALGINTTRHTLAPAEQPPASSKMHAANTQAQHGLVAHPVSSPHMFDRVGSKNLFTSMLGSRNSSAAPSRRQSAASSVDPRAKKVRPPLAAMPPFRFVN